MAPQFAVDGKLRAALLSLYPALDKSAGYWRLTHYLLWPIQVTPEGLPVITRKRLAQLFGEARKLRNNHFTAWKSLEDFKRDILPAFQYSQWNCPEGRARVVLADGLDPVARQHQRCFERRLAAGERVDLVTIDTGERLNAHHKAARRKELQARAMERVYESHRNIVMYQNKLDPQIFGKKVKANLQETVAALVMEPESARKRQALGQLVSILAEPKPFISAVDNSDRAFSLQPSLLTVQGNVRRNLTKGWCEYDLRSAQFAIIAKLWDVPELQTFLRSGESLWEYLFRELGVDKSYKPALKVAIYAVAFGGSERNVRARLATETVDRELAKRFLRLPLIDVVLRARNLRISAALAARQVTTIFRTQIPVRSHQDARSALARQVQAIEVALIKPIYDLAATTKRFQVVLYQFDGVTISYRHGAQMKWEKKIKEVVESKARELGIITELEGPKNE
ncbi:MAG: hypothetical protein WD273_09405 [Trueperaceae bacterium]